MPWARETPANFLTEPVRDVVRAEVCDPHACAGKLYGKPRIFNDLLSSQPLCLNSFGQLTTEFRLASEAVRRLSHARFLDVTSIAFEHSPGRGDARYLNDRSAFDVFLRCRTVGGGAGFVGIEVKYHENLKGKAGGHKPEYDAVADKMGCVAADREPLMRSPLQQIWRDHLLAGATQIVDAYRRQLSNEGSFAAWTIETGRYALRRP